MTATALDLFGPTVGAGGVTVRPSDTRNFSATDTYFKDCSSADIDDGTEFIAAWFNQIQGNLRPIARVNGQTAAGNDIVTPDNSDDNMLLKAIQHLIQRNQPRYSDDTGTANNIIVALSPAPPEYKKGMEIIVKIAANNTGATVINANSLGNVAVVRRDGTALQQGDLLAGTVQCLVFDGTVFQLAWLQIQPGAPIYLQAPRDFYVANTGSDSADGVSLSTPWATLQKASGYITRYNLNGYSISIHAADGTYAAVSVPNMSGSGFVNWIGNHGAPGNCTIAGNGVSAIQAQNCGTSHQFDGFKLTATGTYNADPMCGANIAGSGTAVSLTNIEWGTCSGSHLAVTQNAVVTYAGNMRMSGSPQGNNPGMTSGWHVFMGDGAIIQVPSLSNVTMTITAAITCGNGGGWVQAFYLGFCQIVYGSITGGGAVTGKKFNAQGFAVISVVGNGDDYYPGTIAGTRNNGIYE
jgi:hypothetical protein